MNHISADVTHLSVPREVREWAFQHPKETVQVTDYKISWVHWGVPYNSGDDIVGCAHAWLLLTPWDRKASICKPEVWIWKVKYLCTYFYKHTFLLIPYMLLFCVYVFSIFWGLALLFCDCCIIFLWVCGLRDVKHTVKSGKNNALLDVCWKTITIKNWHILRCLRTL